MPAAIDAEKQQDWILAICRNKCIIELFVSCNRAAPQIAADGLLTWFKSAKRCTAESFTL